MGEIKIENGKITTIVSERQSGMSTLLCKYATDFLKNNNGNVLILSWTRDCAKATRNILLTMYNDKERVVYRSVKRIPDILCGTNYGMIIYDCPDIRDENNLDYREALEEFEIYKFLSSDNEERVLESIKKLNLMVAPEKVIVKTLIQRIEELSSVGDYASALPLCDRIVKLSVLNSQEFMWASKKKQELKYNIFRKEEGKK